MNAIATEEMETGFETFQKDDLVFSPTPPTKLVDLDISQSLAEDLMLRYLYTKGVSSIRGLSKAIKLSFPLLY